MENRIPQRPQQDALPRPHLHTCNFSHLFSEHSPLYKDKTGPVGLAVTAGRCNISSSMNSEKEQSSGQREPKHCKKETCLGQAFDSGTCLQEHYTPQEHSCPAICPSPTALWHRHKDSNNTQNQAPKAKH